MKDKHNAVGASDKPKLPNGGKTVDGLARPGGSRNRVPAASDFSIVGKPGRPGGRQKPPAAGGTPPKVARPGGRQSANRGK